MHVGEICFLGVSDHSDTFRSHLWSRHYLAFIMAGWADGRSEVPFPTQPFPSPIAYCLTLVDPHCRVRSLVSLRFWVRGQPITTCSTPTMQSVIEVEELVKFGVAPVLQSGG